MESGSCDTPEFFLQRAQAFELGMLFSNELGCPTASPRDDAAYLECMRALPTKDVMLGMAAAVFKYHNISQEVLDDTVASDASRKAAMAQLPALAPIFPFGPVIDGTDVGLRQMPLTSIEAGEGTNVPFIIGSNNNEGSR